ncbi:hypothetical protein L6164_019098 [Bauhinia variegata]|uniref:Uncharacterized protein n=1 Tax=Bauhinia variegata TaxID=167791 RepID=A0ACB9NI73_BAUVA|nr:hypothetical protein L6164_019098 [Bauhinia variegata]
MAVEKELRHTMKPWIEVAPMLIDFPCKLPSTPKLETILEERPEAEEDDDAVIGDWRSGNGREVSEQSSGAYVH